MCGILLHVAATTALESACSPLPSWWTAACEVVDQRGPDVPGTRLVKTDQNKNVIFNIHASVLALRGSDIVPQPISSRDGSLLLLWNGEVFDSLDADFDLTQHDGAQLLRAMEERVAERCSTRARPTAIKEAFSHVLSSIDGPYAAVLIDMCSGIVTFGRDPIGRRSLLVAEHQGSVILLSAASKETLESSVTPKELDCSSFWSIADGAVRPFERCQTKFTVQARLAELSAPNTSAAHLRAASSIEARFLEILSASVQVRVQQARPRSTDNEADIAVLFSGGLDCTTLALLTHMHLPPGRPIDLLNVAFENPRSLQSETTSGDGLAGRSSDAREYDVPDRKTGRASWAELQRLAPERTWRFVEIDVPHAEFTRMRPTIEALMAPSESVMDLSIGAALYFASRGRGSIRQAHGGGASEPYTTPARVLLSGLGADELLGGYSRHRRAFERSAPSSDGPMAALVAELQLDLDRLPTRNLGRDDRVLSASGREARYPFLAHGVVHYLASLPVGAKMDLHRPPGFGDKMLLRRIAAAHLGLLRASTLTKRAIQFGARSAKMDSGGGRVKGHERLGGGGAANSVQVAALEGNAQDESGGGKGQS